MDAAAKPDARHTALDTPRVPAGDELISRSVGRPPHAYQPLVAVTLAVAAGIIADRYLLRATVDVADSSFDGAWFAICWCAYAGLLYKQLKALARADERVQLLETIPGVGRKTAEVVVAYLDDPHRFQNARQIRHSSSSLARSSPNSAIRMNAVV